jgi:RNA polymerase sigma-70 factor, ECF subfamily
MIANTMDLPETTDPPGPSPSSIEDAEIAAEIARGELRRFDVLGDRYKKRLMSYLSHRVHDRHRAEDLVQEAFLRLFRAAAGGGYSTKASVATWLFTIADNCATDFLRASRRQPLMLESDSADRNDDPSASVLDCRPSPELDPPEVAARRESQGRAENLLDCLPEEQRRVVALRVIGGLTLPEVAAVVGCPVGTAKSRLLYGLRKIETRLVRLGGPDHER